MNWTAVIVTFLICVAAVSVAERMVSIAKLKLEKARVERDTAYMKRGYEPPRREQR